MPPTVLRWTAGLIVLGLVATSLPVKVWLFGACPVCGKVHHPVLSASLGSSDADSKRDGQPTGHEDADLDHSCFPPLPYGPADAPAPLFAALHVAGTLQPESDAPDVSPLHLCEIRPPRG